jgi:hypothetical protein
LLTANLLLHLNTFVLLFRTSAKSPPPVTDGEALYPRKMSSGPAQPPSPEQPQSAGAKDRAGAASDEQDGVELRADERTGPLTIMRVAKDDGRSLILYGHDESPAELEAATACELERRDGPA